MPQTRVKLPINAVLNQKYAASIWGFEAGKTRSNLVIYTIEKNDFFLSLKSETSTPDASFLFYIILQKI